MRTLAAIAILFFAWKPIYASDSPIVAIAVGYGGSVPAARIQIPADYVAVSITIENDSKDLVKRSEEIGKAFRALREKLAPHPDLKIKTGIVSLSRWSDGADSSFSVSGSRSGSAQLYIAGTLKQDSDLFAVNKQIYQVVASVPLSGGTRITLDDNVLAVNEPEKYRNQLLALIAGTVSEAKQTVGKMSFVTIEGLENPVTVMDVSDRDVVLFVDYRLKVQTTTR